MPKTSLPYFSSFNLFQKDIDLRRGIQKMERTRLQSSIFVKNKDGRLMSKFMESSAEMEKDEIHCISVLPDFTQNTNSVIIEPGKPKVLQELDESTQVKFPKRKRRRRYSNPRVQPTSSTNAKGYNPIPIHDY